MKPRARRIALATVAAGCLVVAGLTFMVATRFPYWKRERELIAIVECDGFDTMQARMIKAHALNELAEMRSARAIPAIIRLWGRPGSMDHVAGQDVMVTIGKPALPYLRAVLEREATEDQRRLARASIEAIEGADCDALLPSPPGP